MLSLATPIENLGFVGTKNAPRLKRLGLKTVKDLLWHFPARYEDYSQKIKIGDIFGVATNVSTFGVVADIKNTVAWRRRMAITDATIEDETGTIHAVWFNQPYLEKTLAIGTGVSLSGKVARDKKGIYLSNPMYEKAAAGDWPLATSLTHTGRLVPVYPETEGVSSKYLRLLIRRALPKIDNLADPLPATLVKKYGFPNIGSALQAIHFPKTAQQAEAARQRFAFEELLLFQLRALRDRRQLQTLQAPKIVFDKELVGNFVRDLPFALTNDQRLATYEILKDLEKPYPMNRLLNGDVGSGKTVVALIAAYQTASQNWQMVFMVPTEILAKQHFATITSLIISSKGRVVSSKGENKIGLLTGSESKIFDEFGEQKISKPKLKQKIAEGEIGIVIGTHAVIQKDVKFAKLGLVVIDEQHRFGVGQRMKLLKDSQPKTYNLKPDTLVPHLLSMTATPIPRTLALTIYGDLDVSLIKEKPKGRQEIVTRVIPHSKRQSAYRFIEEQIKKGRQVFVICPRIEISKSAGLEPEKLSLNKLLWSEVKAVTAEYEKLNKQIFPHRRVAILHGKLKAKEKDEIMKKFKAGHYDILVSTSVVEVGLDVPNAAIMMIESAERFGLAQLHQFRGRVGRSEHQSYCLLFTSNDTATTRRLRALEKTNNGFELAEADLKLRGPGEFTGLKQSGIPDLAMASLSDIDLIKKARQEARLLLGDDPMLTKYPALLTRLAEMQRLVHFE